MTKWLALLSFGLIALTTPTLAQQSLDIIISVPEGNPLIDFAREDLGGAYARLGLTMVLKPLPPARSLEAAATGETDGEAARIAGMTDLYPDLLMVPEPVLDLEMRSIAIGAPLAGSGRASLKGHRLCLLLGDKTVDSFTRGLDREMVRNVESGLRMLHAGRCDAMLIYQYHWLDIERLHLGPVCPSAEVLIRAPLYHYVHRRHADLVSRLAEALRAQHAEGATARAIAPILHRIAEAEARNSCASPHAVKDAAHR